VRFSSRQATCLLTINKARKCLSDRGQACLSAGLTIKSIGKRISAPDEVRELEQRMDTLAREYAETHDQEIITTLNELSRRLREVEKQ